MRGKFPGEALTEIEIPRNQCTGEMRKTKRAENYPQLTVRNTRERRRNRETEKLPRIESSGNHAKIAIPLGVPCTNKCGKKFPGESESKRRRVLTIRQVCVNTRKSSAGSG